MGGLFLDNACVILGVMVFSLIRGPSYDFKKEIRRAEKGLLDLSNWREAMVGFAVLMLFWAILWLLREIY